MYSKEETINYYEVLTVETIQGRKLFKGGNYVRNKISYCLIWNGIRDPDFLPSIDLPLTWTREMILFGNFTIKNITIPNPKNI